MLTYAVQRVYVEVLVDMEHDRKNYDSNLAIDTFMEYGSRRQVWGVDKLTRRHNLLAHYNSGDGGAGAETNKDLA